VQIIRKAIQAPIRQILENSGVEASPVVNQLLTGKSQTAGFNAQTEEFVDLIDAGVIDPTKVVRSALQNAASVAGLLITTEAMIAERPADKKAGGGMPGGMGGMGGMDMDM
jgi:chaperonin GroEL